MEEQILNVLKEMLTVQKDSFADMHRELREIKVRLNEQLGGN